MFPFLYKSKLITIHTYFVAYAVAISIAIISGVLRAKKEGRDVNSLLNVCIWMIFGVLIGGRLMFVFTTYENFKSVSFLRWFFFWEGGQVFYGGLIGGIFSVYIYTSIKRIDFVSLLDFMAPYSMLGYGIHRIAGCFVNGCCYGKPTTLPWGVRYPAVSRAAQEYGYGVKIHPVQIYDGLIGLVLFVILENYRRKNPDRGNVSIFFLLFYSFARFFLEFFRGDTMRGFLWDGVSISQGVSFLIFITCGSYYLLRRK